MIYRQDSVPRVCSICEKHIVEDELMIDLFREESSAESSGITLEWAHFRCVRQAIETFVKKRRERLSKT